VFHYFRLWRRAGAWERIHTALRERLRQQVGCEPTTSAAIIDSQSVKTTELDADLLAHGTLHARRQMLGAMQPHRGQFMDLAALTRLNDRFVARPEAASRPVVKLPVWHLHTFATHVRDLAGNGDIYTAADSRQPVARGWLAVVVTVPSQPAWTITIRRRTVLNDNGSLTLL
jgi:hypothetical protein